MKKLSCILCLFIIYSNHTAAQSKDTTINGVAVFFKYDASIFPKDWLTAEINAKGVPINPSEIERTKNVAVIALKKYPVPVLAANLKAVYFLKEMEFFHTGFGGTNSRDNLYLTNDGYASGYTNDYIEQTFHHEFSSILFRNHVNYLDTAAWSAANVAGFIYNDPQEGVGAINNNQSSQTVDTILCKKGILTQYALSAMENDLNTLAQNLFRPAKGFWKAVDKYPRIKTKVTLLIAFYHHFSPAYSEYYFRKFNTDKDDMI